MHVYPINALTDNYIWAITYTDSLFFDCVDPGESDPVIEFAGQHGLKLRAILLTHHHQDHIGGTTQLLHHFHDAMVYAPETLRIPHVTHQVKNQDTIPLTPYQFRILEIPGHTSSHIAYYEPNYRWLFCGDTLFSAGCGRVFDGSIETLFASIQTINQLPDDTLIFCAHEYTQNNLRFAKTVEPENKDIQAKLLQLTTHSIPCTLPSPLSQERLLNPFLRTDNTSVIQYALKHGAQNPTAFEVFKTLRSMKDQFK